MFCCVQADETQSFILTVLGGRLQNQNTTLSKIQSCVICFGKTQSFLSISLTPSASEKKNRNVSNMNKKIRKNHDSFYRRLSNI